MKNRILSMALAAVLSAGLFSAPVQEYISSSSVVCAASAVSAPTASRKSGTYSASGAFSVKLTSATAGAKIYYSTGSGYKLYTKALRISKNTTVKCYAEINGEKSKTVTLKYKLTPKVTVSKAAGSYSDPVTVKLSSTASGVKFYYTLDGSKPTTKSALYSTKGITVSKTATLRIAAVKSGWSTKYITRDYVIEGTSGLPDSSLLDDYTDKFGYTCLTATQKRVYAELYKAAENHSPEIDISSLGATPDDMQTAFWAMNYGNPQFFWLGNGCSFSYNSSNTVTTVRIKYSRTKSEAEQIQPKLEAAAQKIIDKALRQDELFDRIRVIHDSIINMTTYTTTGAAYISAADGPLLHGAALCEGYSKAFAYLCQSIGVDCICVSGYANGSHSWNMIKLEGSWYNVDVTWDDPENGDPVYDYLCLPTSMMKADHTLKNLYPVPSATATAYSYCEATGNTFYTGVSSAYEGLVAQVAANNKKGIKVTTVYADRAVLNSLYTKALNSQFYRDLAAAGCTGVTSWNVECFNMSVRVTI